MCSRSFSRNSVLREELLERYRQVTFNDDGVALEGAALLNFLRGHSKAIIGLERIDDSVLQSLPELKVVSKYGVGLDGIDIDAMKRYGRRLGWTGGVNRRSVSELALSFAILMLRHVVAANRAVLSGDWRQHVGRQLTGKIVGIIGCGHVGKDVVRLLEPFECKVLSNDVVDYPSFYAEYAVEPVSLEELLTRADVVTLHVPLDESTRGMLSARRLHLMKPEAVLVNTARGGLVDEVALKEMLRDGRLHAAAFDVFAVEPPEDHELLELSNFLVTPHIGGSAHEAILAMGRAAIAGLD